LIEDRAILMDKSFVVFEAQPVKALSFVGVALRLRAGRPLLSL